MKIGNARHARLAMRSKRHFSRVLTFALLISLIGVPVTLIPARADTSGSGICQQTFTKSGTGQVDVVESGGYCFVAFKNTGSIETQTTFSWTRPTDVLTADVLVVGGGGGGGARHGGGGGAGAYVENTGFDISSATSISIVVGAGGGGANGSTTYTGNSGATSSFKLNSFGLVANGGGAGTSGAASATTGSSSGGSGSGQTSGSVTAQTQTKFDGSSINGITFGNIGSGGANDLNSGIDNSYDYWAGGGGGGAGAAGARPTSNGSAVTTFPSGTWATARGGNGGNGKVVSWLSSTIATTLSVGQVSGSDVYFAGGGGGGIGNDGLAGGTGGLGGGANGTRSEASPTGASSFTGGGGGGGGFDDIYPATGFVTNGPGSNGGSGIVIVRFARTQSALTVTSTAAKSGTPLNLTTSGGSGSGAVSFSVTSAGTANCSISGSTLSASSAGTCTVTATKAAADGYLAVSSIATTIRVAVSQTIDYAINFDGSSSKYASVSSQIIPNSSPFTAEAWFKSNDTVSYRKIFSQGDLGAGTGQRQWDNSFYVEQNSGKIRVVQFAATAYVLDCGTYSTNSWTHVAVVYNNPGLSCYINGFLTGSDNTKTLISTTAKFMVGNFSPDPTAASCAWNGAIDEVRIYNSARSQSQIQTDFKTYGPITEANLVSYYDFNEGSGSTASNQKSGSLSATDLTITGSPSSSDVAASTNNGTKTVVTFTRTYLTNSGGWKAPTSGTSIEYLVIGGGGGGGAAIANEHGGGGGGAGGYRTNVAGAISGANSSPEASFTVSSSVYEVVVGLGGLRQLATSTNGSPATPAGKGGDSKFGNITALGGGGGADYFGNAASTGGSGGGGAISNSSTRRTGALGTSGQGFKGGDASSGIYDLNAGGGGGAGSAGGTGSVSGPGSGGNGLSSSITGSAVNRALGGQGGSGTNSATVTTAAANTGNGGGGGSVSGTYATPGDGGSGLVVISYAHSYTVTYEANKDQHQTGVTSGTVPTSETVTSGGSYTVANQGTLTRQGFTFSGWKDQNGNSIAPGSSITVSANLTLSAQWTIPTSAKLIGSGTETVYSVASAGNIRGITSDGTYIYYRPNGVPNVIRQVNLNGTGVIDRTVTANTVGGPTLSANAGNEDLDLTYSNGCIFIRSNDYTKLYCINTSTWKMSEVTVPVNKPLPNTNLWLHGNLIDFPDGRIGAVSSHNQSLTPEQGVCPAGMFCKVLRLYKPSGTGNSLTITWDEDIVLADSESSWPYDNHGIATDGTYLYQLRHASGYKVWALQSNSPSAPKISYLVFNGDGSGACGASGTLCSITPTGITNATYFGRIHSENRYVVGDYGAAKFYLTQSVAPPSGPGTAAEAPVITTHPQSSTKATGQSVTFNATVSAVSDGGTLSYVWKKNGTVISGANSTTYSISNIQSSDAGDYTFEVTNTLGSKTTTTISNVATLALLASQNSVTVSSAASVTYGSTLTLTASGGSGTGAYSFTRVSGDCTLSGTGNNTLTPSSATTCVVKAKRAGDGTYLDSDFSADFTVTIIKKPLTLTVKPVNRNYNGQSTISLKNNSASTITKSDLSGVLVGDSSNVDVDLNKLQATVTTPDVATGKTVTATVLSGFLTGTKASNYELPTITVATTVDIAQATQSSISFTPASSLRYGDTLNLLATGGDGTGAYEYAKVSGNCTVTSAVVIPTSGTGTCVVKARKAGDTNYSDSAYSADKTITLGKASQSINFTSAVPSIPIAGGTYTVSSSATSTLATSFTSTTTGVCSVAGATVTFNTSGTCTIKSEQIGNDNYSAASAVFQTIVVGKKNQQITFPAIANKSYGGASFSAGASVDSGLTLSYSSANAAICTVTPATGVVTPVGVGQCSITVSQASGDSVYAPASDVVRSFDIDPVTPTAPRITSVSFGDSSVTVAYTQPSSTGGADVLAYRAVATPTSGTEVIKTDCSVSGICEINGLVNGSSYQVVVSAINSAGTGEISNTSPSITPATTPDAVTNLATIPGDETLAVSWVAPVSFGGGTFDKYQIIATPRNSSALTPIEISNVSTTSYTFSGLTNGTAYDVTVTVLSTANTSSLSSNTTTALGVPATVPSAPRNFTVLELSRTSAFLSWTVPTSNGGNAITGYEVLPAGCTLSSPTDTNCTITGRTAGSTVQFSVAAVNDMGTSTAATATHTFTADPVSETQSPSPEPATTSTPTSSPSPSAGSTATPRTTSPARPTASTSPSPTPSPTPSETFIAPQSLFPALQDAPYPTNGLAIPDPGEVLTVLDGQPFVPTITTTAIDTLIEFPDGTSITMWSQTTDGTSIPIEPGGAVRVLQGAVIYAEGSGFAADSPVEAWLFSEPKRLGGGYASTTGQFSSQYVVASDAELGDHTLVLNGLNKEEKLLTIALGVTIVDQLDSPEVVAVDDQRNSTVVLIEQLAGIAFGFVIFGLLWLTYRRRVNR